MYARGGFTLLKRRQIASFAVMIVVFHVNNEIEIFKYHDFQCSRTHDNECVRRVCTQRWMDYRHNIIIVKISHYLRPRNVHNNK